MSLVVERIGYMELGNTCVRGVMLGMGFVLGSRRFGGLAFFIVSISGGEKMVFWMIKDIFVVLVWGKLRYFGVEDGFIFEIAGYCFFLRGRRCKRRCKKNY